MIYIIIQIFTKIPTCKYIIISLVFYNFRQYEKIVIEDVLESSGISLKPTKKQLSEFSKKIKSLNHELILRNIFERMNKSVIENDFKTLGKLLYVIQEIIQDSNNVKYINFLKQQAKLFENIFNRNINKMINITSAEIYKSLTNTNLMKADEFLNENNNNLNMNMNNNVDSSSSGNNAPNPLDAFINKANQKIKKQNMTNNNTGDNNNEKKYDFIKRKNEEISNNNLMNNFNNGQNINKGDNNNLLTNIEDDIISNINNNLQINNDNNNQNQKNNINNVNNNQNINNINKIYNVNNDKKCK